MAVTGRRLELCWGTVQDASLSQLLHVAAQEGFACVTAAPRHYQEARARGLAKSDVRAMVADSGVRVTCIDAFAGAFPNSVAPVELVGDATEAAVYETAEVLGATAVSVVDLAPKPTPWGALVDAFGAFCERASARDLRVLVEFIPRTGIATLAAAMRLIHEAANANVGIVLDSLHLHLSGGRPDDLGPQALDLVGAIQLNDRTLAQDAEPYRIGTERLPPGDGELPLLELTRRLLSSDNDVPLGVELFGAVNRSLGPAAAAHRAGAAMRRLLEQADAGGDEGAT